MRTFRIPRRSFLRGAGVSILLPALDIMLQPRTSMAGAGPGASPRYAAFFLSLGMWGHGYDPTKNDASRYYEIRPGDPKLGTGTWHPTLPGPLMSPLPAHLAPFESLKQKLMIVSGLSTLPGDPDGTNATHSLPTTCWLTSAYKSGGGHGGTPPDSVDQYIANAMGFTPGSTLVLSPSASDITESTGGHQGNVSSNSRLGGNHLVPKVTDPMKVFNQLFGKCSTAGSGASQTASLADDKSVLDYVMGSVAGLQRNLGRDDSARLEAYLQNIRDVENNLTAAGPALCPTTPPAYDPALSGGSLDWLATLRMMVDVVALAMASDAMPIATIMTDIEATRDPYASRVEYASDFIGISGKKVTYSSNSLDTHFDITHKAVASATQTVEEWFAYTRVLMLVAQRLALKLDAFPAEPNGNTPLDNSLLQIGCAHSHAYDHTTHNLPVILLGGKNLQMRQGQYVQVPNNTDIGDFYYTMLQAMQVPGTDFNGSRTSLPGLFG